MSIRILSTGSYIPINSYKKPEHINGFRGAGDDAINIFSSSGERRICDTKETPTYMGAQAAHNAIKNAAIEPKTIEAILCYTAVSDHETPKDVYKIADVIGCDGAMCWTIDTACASFLTHFHCAYTLSLSGIKRVLIINSMNWVTRAFNKQDGQFAGDGAAAVIVENSNKNQHFIGCKEISSTAQFEFIKLKSAQVSGVREEIIFSKDKKTILRAVDILPEVADQLIDEKSINKEEINWVICHQPGIPAIERWHDELKIPIEKNLNTYNQFGNMSAANIPITLDYYFNENPVIQKDDIILLFSGGAGIHVAAMLYRM